MSFVVARVITLVLVLQHSTENYSICIFTLNNFTHAGPSSTIMREILSSKFNLFNGCMLSLAL